MSRTPTTATDATKTTTKVRQERTQAVSLCSLAPVTYIAQFGLCIVDSAYNYY